MAAQSAAVAGDGVFEAAGAFVIALQVDVHDASVLIHHLLHLLNECYLFYASLFISNLFMLNLLRIVIAKELFYE